MKASIVFTLLNLILITAIVFFGVQLFYQVTLSKIAMSEISGPQPAAVSTAGRLESNNGQVTRNPISHYEVIVARNLFATRSEPVSRNKAREVENIAALDATALDVRLWGTVAGDPRTSFAIIESTPAGSRRKTQNLYREGDAVQNARIKKILRNKVVLSINGKDEILEMEKMSSTSGSVRRSSVASRSVPPVRQRRVIKKSMIDDALKDVNQIMTQARIHPHAEGLTISRIKPNSIFRRLGLRNGDIITGVDGRRIESVDDALSLYRNLRSGASLSLELKRRGRSRVINYQIR